MTEYKDADAGNPEPFIGRARRFAEECRRFETRFGISLAAEIGDLAPPGHFARIAQGEIDVIDGLRPNDLWAVLISLHVDLSYILWDTRTGELPPGGTVSIQDG